MKDPFAGPLSFNWGRHRFEPSSPPLSVAVGSIQKSADREVELDRTAVAVLSSFIRGQG